MRCSWLAWVSVAAACAGPAEFVGRPPQPIAWPSTVATPRVELEFAYGGSADVLRHRGFLDWLGSLFAGEEEEHMISPTGLAASADVLWIADAGAACVHRLSLSTGEHRRMKGHVDHPFATPIGVAVHPDGRVFVTDSGTGMITVLGPTGEPQRCFGGPGIIERPTGICFDEHRARVLVVDTVGCRLLAFDPDGRLLETKGGRGVEPGLFNYPTNLALMSDGRIVIVDSLNFRVQLLSPDLEPVAAFGRVGRGPGDFANPKGVAVDSHDNIYVVDSMFDNFQIFDSAGHLLLAVASTGSGHGELYLPSGIHIDRLDRIYLGDAGNSRVQVMQLQAGAQ